MVGLIQQAQSHGRFVLNTKALALPWETAFQRILSQGMQAPLTQAEVALPPEHLPVKEQGYALLIQAEAYRYCKQPAQAILLYAKALALQPHLSDAWRALLNLQEQGQAINLNLLPEQGKLWERAVKACPFETAFLLLAAKASEQEGKTVQSERYLKRLLSIQPEQGEARFQLALLYENQNRWDEAIACYQALLTFEPACTSALHNLASIAMRLGKFKQAEQGFKALLSLKPKFSKAALGMGLCLEHQNRNAEAIPFYHQFINMKPEGEHASFVRQRLLKLLNETKTCAAKVSPSALLRRVK